MASVITERDRKPGTGTSVGGWGKWLFLLVLLVLALLTRIDSFILFHSFSELFSIAIAAAVFIIAWNSDSIVKNNYLLILGVGSLFIALIDTVHTLGYQGMNLLTAYGPTLSTQLWLSARFMQALPILVAPIFLHRRLHKAWLVLIYAAVT